jgi:hypothetical protein
VKELIQKDFNDVVECSESAGATFVGFKNTLSLGIKIDKSGKIKNVGNYEMFPRNL